MKAAIIESIGNLTCSEAPMPVIGPGEALIKVKYIGVCGTDNHVLDGHHPTAVYPLIPGHEFVGTVEEVNGKGTDRFQKGDLVVAQEILSCGSCDACAKGMDNICNSLQIIGVHVDGGFAEYVKVLTHKMYKLPGDIDLQLAALTEPLAVAVHDVRKSGLKAGETALVVGGGPIGLLIAIVARASGARKVVISEISDYRRGFAKDMGFDVINPLDEDFAEKLAELGEHRGFDVSFEAAGVQSAIDTCIDFTKNTGTVVVIAIATKPPQIDTGKIFAKELTLEGVRIHSQYSFIGAVDLIKSGTLDDELKKIISGIYPLEQVAEAFDYAKNGKDSFKVLVKVND